jgi:hypothetical protein
MPLTSSNFIVFLVDRLFLKIPIIQSACELNQRTSWSCTVIIYDPFGAFHCHSFTSFTSMSSENRSRRGQMASNTDRSTSAQLPETRHPPSDGAHANIFTGALAMAVLSNSRNSRQKSQKNSGTSWGNHLQLIQLLHIQLVRQNHMVPWKPREAHPKDPKGPRRPGPAWWHLDKAGHLQSESSTWRGMP